MHTSVSRSNIFSQSFGFLTDFHQLAKLSTMATNCSFCHRMRKRHTIRHPLRRLVSRCLKMSPSHWVSQETPSRPPSHASQAVASGSPSANLCNSMSTLDLVSWNLLSSTHQIRTVTRTLASVSSPTTAGSCSSTSAMSTSSLRCPLL